MFRSFIVSAAAVSALTLAPVAALTVAVDAHAAPALCAEHGKRYITACANSTGGGGASEFALNDTIRRWNETPSHPNYGKYPHVDR